MLASRSVATAAQSTARPAAHGEVSGNPATLAAASRASWPALLLGAGLVAVLFYAAAAGGATRAPADARVEVALSLLAALGAAAWLFGPLRLAAPRLAWAGLALLAGFATWSALSIAWSVAPDATWTAANRTLAYVLAVVLAFAFGASHPRAARRAAEAGVCLVLPLALYALGGKLAPGLDVLGLSLNHTGFFARLREPLDYWNALGLLCAMTAPLALALAVDTERRSAIRLAALAALLVFLLVLGFTYSRGSVIALLPALAVSLGAGGARLRSLLVFGLAALATAPTLAFAFTTPALTSSLVPLGAREDAGLDAALIFLGSLALLLAAGLLLGRLERRIPPDPRRSRRIGAALGVVAVALLLAGLGVVAASDRGLGGTVADTWREFKETREKSVADPARLVSASSANRWEWWEEAAGAFSAKPVAGWGASSFPVTHMLYRTRNTSVRQPHSMPLQFLAETGVVGAFLALTGLLLLVAAAVRSARGRPAAAALAATAVAWLAGSLADWHWDIPGVTLLALGAAGVATASATPPPRDPSVAPPPAITPRALGLAAAVLVLCVTAVCAALPALSRSETDRALERPGKTRAERERAIRRALVAARIDPLASEPLLAAATLAERANRPNRARGYIRRAIAREPNLADPWVELAQLAADRGDTAELDRAARRALELDPRSPTARGLAARAAAAEAPAGGSPTATGTPLSPSSAP
jgi:O-Antigen ligase